MFPPDFIQSLPKWVVHIQSFYIDRPGEGKNYQSLLEKYDTHTFLLNTYLSFVMIKEENSGRNAKNKFDSWNRNSKQLELFDLKLYFNLMFFLWNMYDKHTSYLSILVHRRIIEVYKKYTKKLSELATK